VETSGALWIDVPQFEPVAARHDALNDRVAGLAGHLEQHAPEAVSRPPHRGLEVLQVPLDLMRSVAKRHRPFRFANDITGDQVGATGCPENSLAGRRVRESEPAPKAPT
jgi:hypothetical protein